MSQNRARGFAVSIRNHNCGLTWHALVTTTLHNLPSQPPFATSLRNNASNDQNRAPRRQQIQGI
jgi:hypothetical protein